MFREIVRVASKPGEPQRRWFADETMDLFVWVAPEGGFSGFQLSYGKPAAEHAVSWKQGVGYDSTRIDDGVRPGRHPGSPMLVANGGVIGSDLLAVFESRVGENMDEAVLAFMREHLDGLVID